ncbi:CIC11C00000005146 [Sungouiella intermedia]|uniref:CIC11C00000005146 n=1 Tax=Sungouiella intermedia TaxID=45354 RepID=A0A1L0BBH7_9ASCO|nr:CIC11C00000005146 [[Candida] intermedia]
MTKLDSENPTKDNDSVHVNTESVVQTPDVIAPSPSYFPFTPGSTHTKPQQRPPLEYHASEIELGMLDHIPVDFHQVPSHTDLEDGTKDHSDSHLLTFTRRKHVMALCASCLWAFCQGFADGAPGALLPYMEEYYHIGYSLVSLIWICNASGVISFAPIAHRILLKLGFRYSLVAACCCSVVMHSIVCTGTKFPVICLAYFIGGVGLSVAGSQLNIFVSRYEKASLALGYFHGCYGLGASVSPLIATVFVSKGYKWHTFYFVLLGLSAFAAINAFIHFSEADQDMKAIEEHNEVKEEQPKSILVQALKSKTTWLLGFFVLFYQGSEVSVGAWVVTYIRDYRGNHDTSVGYVASGYWFGLTFGRLVMTPTCHHYLGARVGNSLLICLSLILVGMTWAIPSTLGEGICVSLAGICIGPIYPLMITVVSGVVPRKIQVVSLVFASAFGYSGGALFPFLIGLISQFKGAFVMLPAFLAMFTATLVIWLCLPKLPNSKGLTSTVRKHLGLHRFFA